MGPAGPQGEPGLTTLQLATPDSSHCLTGGMKIEQGVDANGDGLLDPGEIDPGSTYYVCNGEMGPRGDLGPAGPEGPQGAPGPQGDSGRNALQLVTPDTSHCASGGVRISTGVDLDVNVQLDPAEIDAGVSWNFCNGATGPSGEEGP